MMHERNDSPCDPCTDVSPDYMSLMHAEKGINWEWMSWTSLDLVLLTH